MQATCSICGVFKADCAPCPKCGQIVALCCFEILYGCCTACKVERPEDEERPPRTRGQGVRV